MNNTKKLVETAMLVSLAFVFDVMAKLIPIMSMPQGGSFSFAMLPLFILAFHLGIGWGTIGGVCFGLINCIFDGYVNSPASLFLDYLIAFGVIGLAGLAKRWIYKKNDIQGMIIMAITMTIVVTLRCTSHIFAGVIAWDTELWASTVYNAPYCYASLVGCIIVGILIYKPIKKVLVQKTAVE